LENDADNFTFDAVATTLKVVEVSKPVFKPMSRSDVYRFRKMIKVGSLGGTLLFVRYFLQDFLAKNPKNEIHARFERAAFSVLRRCDNHYTNGSMYDRHYVRP